MESTVLPDSLKVVQQAQKFVFLHRVTWFGVEEREVDRWVGFILSLLSRPARKGAEESVRQDDGALLIRGKEQGRQLK